MKISLPGNTIIKPLSKKNYISYQNIYPIYGLDLGIKGNSSTYLYLSDDNGFEVGIFCGTQIPTEIKDLERLLSLSASSVDILNSGSDYLGLLKWKRHPNISNQAESPESIKDSRIKVDIIEENIEANTLGLRNPQIGALYSILSHYTVSNQVATIVMPTGTGKTETMLVAFLKLKCNKLLVVVPTDALRTQIAQKFIDLGKLRYLKIIGDSIKAPIVGVIKSIITDQDKINEITNNVNVVITTADCLNQELIMSGGFTHLFIDEAHHTPAPSWKQFKSWFGKKNILQFTATPFRLDGQRIEGKIIYNYPLKKAQIDGCFKNINFRHIFEIEDELVHEKIRDLSVSQLREDIGNDKNHILMARCKNIKQAEEIYDRYYSILSEFNPVLIHSRLGKRELDRRLMQLKTLQTKIVVCVDMLGEGYDLPNLKIAAMHYAHKSLGVTLQFIGRFTRNGDSAIGNATFVANIADEKVRKALKSLYSENADWNYIIQESSYSEIQKQISFQEFIEGFGTTSSPEIPELSIQNIVIPYSVYFIKTNSGFQWDSTRIQEHIESYFEDKGYPYLNDIEKTLVVIEKTLIQPDFGGIKDLVEIKFNAYILHYNEELKCMYMFSSDKNIDEKLLSKILGEYEIINKDDVFKAFYGINRLQLSIYGAKDGIPGKIKYRMSAGEDIWSALTSLDIENKIISNVFTFGFENGEDITLGASVKGKIRAKYRGNILERKTWADGIINKLQNPHIDPKSIFEGMLKPTKIEDRPTLMPISIEWQDEIYYGSEELYKIEDVHGNQFSLQNCDILIENPSLSGDLLFKICNEEGINLIFKHTIEKNEDDELICRYVLIGENNLKLLKSNKETERGLFFQKYPPIIRFNNGSFMIDNFYYEIKNSNYSANINEILQPLERTGYDITAERQGIESKNIASIQYRITQDLISSNKYDLIINDDGSGEIADVVGIIIDKEEQTIEFELYHCKYSSESTPGARIGDLYEVCGQAQKSIKRTKGDKICGQLIKRCRKNPGRMEQGLPEELLSLKDIIKIFSTKTSIYIVQPGLSKQSASEDQKALIAVTENYLKSTYKIPLIILCSQ